MPAKLKYEFVKRFLLEKDIELLCSRYIGAQKPMLARCYKCNDIFDCRFNDVQQGHGCPKCAGVKKYTYEQVQNICFSRNIRVLTPEKEYVNARQDILLKCLSCSNQWYKDFIRINIRKYGCPKCSSTRRKKTNLLKYGVDHPSKNKEIALKGARTANQITILKHWLSREDIYCRGTYEVAVIEYFNKNQVDYNFQPQTFLMPSGHTYTPDIYLPDQDLWVEIKGTFRDWDSNDDARRKWDWFHKEYSNSELWNKQKLKELGLWKRILQLRGQKNKQKQEILSNESVT